MRKTRTDSVSVVDSCSFAKFAARFSDQRNLRYLRLCKSGALFMRMFLPLEEGCPLGQAVAAALAVDHADQFPGLRTQIGSSRFKFLLSLGFFRAVLPLHHRQGLDVEREVLSL